MTLCSGLLATYAGWRDASQDAAHELDEQFQRRVSEVRSSIDHHFEETELFLRVGSSLHHASHEVDADEWQKFFANLPRGDDFFGLIGVGYLDRSRLPAGKPLTHFYRYLPISPDLLDRFPDSERRAAMALAANTGNIAITGSIEATDPSTGRLHRMVMLYLPVYRTGGTSPITAPAREAALQGFVFSINDIDLLLGAALGQLHEDLDVHVYEGRQVDDLRLIYDIDNQDEAAYPRTGRQWKETFSVGGRDWTVLISIPATDAADEHHRDANTWLIGGLLASLALFVMIWSLTSKRATAIAQAEAMRMRARESEELWQFALEHSGDGVWDWDLVRERIKLTPRWAATLGLEAAPDYPQARLTNLIDKDDAVRLQERLKTHWRGQAPAFECECRLRLAGSKQRWILLRGRLVESRRDSTPTRMVGTCADITDQKALRQRLLDAKETAESANLAKSEFLSRMSHELRTPLNAILGFAQLMENDPVDRLPAGQAENLHHILEAGWHLLELINEVLDLTRIESGHLELISEPVRCIDAIGDSMALVRPQAEQRAITIETAGAGKPRMLIADRKRLRQILLNLISNAIKYNRVGGSVRIGCSPGSSGRARIAVTDTGPGLSRDEMARLFRPFERLGAAGSDIEGTGIGLALSKRLAEAMGGALGVESTPGKGSTFWVELPVAEGPSAETSRPDGTTNQATAPEASIGSTSESPRPEQTLEPAPQGKTPQRRVLYIEDNAANMRLMQKLLSKRGGIAMLPAESPELGLELAISHAPELILLDINLPRMDGYTVLSRLRQQATTRAIPVVAVSAQAAAADIQNALRAGFDAYLAKPIDLAELDATLERFLPPPSAGMTKVAADEAKS